MRKLRAYTTIRDWLLKFLCANRMREREHVLIDLVLSLSLALITLSEHCMLPPIVYALNAQAIKAMAHKKT